MTSLHSLQVSPGVKSRKMRVGRGRGSGKGRTCGRGHKGQYARSGHKHKPGFEGGQMRLLRRISKRGFNRGHKVAFKVVAVEALNRFENDVEVTPQLLKQAGLLQRAQDPVKVLGGGELSRKLSVRAHAFSQSARDKIIAAGGSCTEIT